MLCLYGVRELAKQHHETDQSEHSLDYPRPMRVDQAAPRYLLLPGGARNGPGSPSVCREAEESKYCHNYYSLLPSQYCKLPTTSTLTPTQSSTTTSAMANETTTTPTASTTTSSSRVIPDVADFSKLIPDFRLMDFLNNPHFGSELRIDIADMSGMFGEKYQEEHQ